MHSYKKIISFLPSATEILFELGAGNSIVGVTHQCNYPDKAKDIQRIVDSSFNVSEMSSKDIDKKIVELYRSGRDIYVINEQKLKQLQPDLIVAQGICEVCSPYTKEIKRAISILGYSPEILILHSHNLEDILMNITKISSKIMKIQEGQKLVKSLQSRIDFIKNITSNSNIKISQKILCLEWLNPFFTAGHWVPEMITLVGGINSIGTAQQPSRRTDIDKICDSDPDKIILMPCGFDIKRTLCEYRITLEKDVKWNYLNAVKNNEIYIVDAAEYFSKPGPRTITGLEILAKIIHPHFFYNLQIPDNSIMQLSV